MYRLVGILCFSSVPYLFSLRGNFVFDDSEAIVKNKDVYSGSWTNSFFNDFWGTNIMSNLSHKSYRPLTILSFRLNYFVSGQQLLAYHFKITNVICHAVCTILVWQTFSTILKRTKMKRMFWIDEAYLSALLFSVHPVHTEAVSGIVGRADILAGITLFLAFLAYDKAISPMKFQYLFLVITLLTSGMSMIFKENGVTALGLCIIYELVIKLKIKQVHRRKMLQVNLSTGAKIRMSIVLLTLLIFLYGRWAVMGGTNPEFKPTDNPASFSNDSFAKIMTYNYIYFLNILLLAWPHWLCYDWSMGCVPLIESVYDYRIVFVLLMYLYGILIIKALLDNRNKQSTKRCIILATSLIVLPFLPAANIFYPVGFVIAERVLYISSAGFCLLIVIGLRRIIQMKLTSKIGIFLYILLLLSFALKSWQRSYEWRNEYLLFTSGLSVCPLNAKVRYNVAKAADAERYTAWALQEYRTAISLYPEYYQAMNNLANLLKNLKQYDEAEFYLRKALSYKQDFPAAWMNLGIVLANKKRYKESFDAYTSALKYRSEYPDCFYNLGNLHLEMNETEAAMNTWFEAIELNPQHNLAWTNLLALLDNTGQIGKALQIIPQALKELPTSPSVNFAIANIYGKIDRYEDAERHFIKAINLFDKKVQAIHYANLGQIGKALQIIPQALKELPTSPSVNFAIANIYGKIDRYEDAERHFIKAINLFDKKVQAIHYANLGVLYHRWKKYSEAQKMYENALNIDPQFKSASRNLKSLLKLSISNV